MIVTDFNLFISRARRFGIYFFFIEQVPSQISSEVTSSAKLKIAFNTLAEEVISTAKIMGLKREQAEVLPELAIGQCICVLGGPRWPHAMVLDTPKYHTNITSLPQREIDRLCRQGMEDLEADVKPRYLAYEEGVTARKDSEKDPDALTRNECKVLGCLAEGPKTLERTRLCTGLDTQQESIARSGLMKKGLARCAGSFGNKRKVHCLTDKGAAKAAEMGFSVYRYKSGPIHETILNETEISLGVAIQGSKFQRRNIVFHGVQPDSLMFFPGASGTRAAIQIVCSTGNCAREASNIRKLAGISELEFVIVVAAKRELQRAVEKALRKEFDGEIPGKIRSINAEQILDPGWDWIAQFE